MMPSDATQFIQVVNELITNRLTAIDRTTLCIIESVNEDGTVNVYIPPDNSNVFHDIINESKYTLKQGDKALLYLVGGRTYNSFIIAKVKN